MRQGGGGGLEELLEALSDPTHPEHENHRAWVGDDYDPGRFDLRAANTFLGLAVQWRGIRAEDS